MRNGLPMASRDLKKRSRHQIFKELGNRPTVCNLQRLHPYPPKDRYEGQWGELCPASDRNQCAGAGMMVRGRVQPEVEAYSARKRPLLDPNNNDSRVQRYTLQRVNPKHDLARLVGYYNT